MFLIKHQFNVDYGISGTPTPYVDIEGNQLHVGDFVLVNHNMANELIVVEKNNRQYIYGIGDFCLPDWKVKILTKWYDLKGSPVSYLKFEFLEEEY